MAEYTEKLNLRIPLGPEQIDYEDHFANNFKKIESELGVKYMFHASNHDIKPLSSMVQHTVLFNTVHLNEGGMALATTGSFNSLLSIDKPGFYRFQLQASVQTDTTGDFWGYVRRTNSDNSTVDYDIITSIGSSGSPGYVNGERVIEVVEPGYYNFYVVNRTTTTKNMYSTYASVQKI